MAYSARIDELEKKFSENARRYFAPLANEYRKAGDLDRAIEICRAHLPQQPGHMSGHIVYGQALYESRQLEEAKTVFEAALALDPENLIALRHLGDIARDSNDPASARAWYTRVLDADPRNDDVAALVAELDSVPAEAPAAPEGGGASGWGDINPERAADETGGAAAASPGDAQVSEAAEPAPDDLEVVPEPDQSATIGVDPPIGPASAGESRAEPRSGGAVAPARAEDAESGRQQPSLDRMLNDAFSPDADTQEMEAGTGVSSAAFARPEAADGVIAPTGPRPEGASPTGEQGALGDGAFAEVDALFDEIASEGTPTEGRTSDRGAGAASTRATGDSPSSATGDALFGDAAGEAPSASPEAGRMDGLETSEFVAPSRAPAEPPRSRRTTGSMAVSGLTSFQQPTEEDSSTRAAFVTETMAELYLQQGFTDEALDIYRQLLEQNPDDTNLRDRIEQLERGGQTSLSVAAVSSEVIQAAQQRHAARPVRTARSFFGRLAGQHVSQRDDAEREATDESSEEFGQSPDEERQPDASSEVHASGREGREPEPEAAAPRASERRPTGSGIAIVSDLFGEVEVSEADEAAASMLASAFSGAFPAVPSPPQPSVPSAPPKGAGTAGRPARAAGSELSLDQVFRDSANRQPRKSGPFSFDQFFSDGSQSGAPEGPVAEETARDQETQAPEGDLEQFTAWLEGLKRK